MVRRYDIAEKLEDVMYRVGEVHGCIGTPTYGISKCVIGKNQEASYRQAKLTNTKEDNEHYDEHKP